MAESHFDIGKELYLRGEYNQAVEQFILGIVLEHDAYSMMWLGQCYEYGLGVQKDLAEAKDLYTVSAIWLHHHDNKGRNWLQERLVSLQGTPEARFRTIFYDGIGNVKVIKSKNVDEPTVRFNLDETVITINYKDTFHSGYHYAKENLHERNRKWSCDSSGRRFHDGYHLVTDYFTLEVRRGNTHKYVKKIDGNKLTLTFPYDANLDYIYVQESILKKVKEILFSFAQDTLPEVLAEVSRHIGVPYRKCRVIMSSQSFVACNFGNGNDITFTAQCIQLPVKSLEALCIHELTHNFVNGHARNFYDEMEKIGGPESIERDKFLWKENMWPYLRF